MTLDEAKATCQSSYPNTSPLVLQAAEEGSKNIANGKERMLPIEALGLAMASCATTYSRSQKEEVEDKIHLKKNEAYGELCFGGRRICHADALCIQRLIYRICLLFI